MRAVGSSHGRINNIGSNKKYTIDNNNSSNAATATHGYKGTWLRELTDASVWSRLCFPSRTALRPPERRGGDG